MGEGQRRDLESHKHLPCSRIMKGYIQHIISKPEVSRQLQYTFFSRYITYFLLPRSRVADVFIARSRGL